MLLLTSTSDLLELVTGSTQTIQVHCDYADNNAGSITPGRLNSIISTATTTSIVGSPSSGVQRNIKTVNIYNDGASSESVTVEHTDGTNVIILASVTLLPGESLAYDEGHGWSRTTANGAEYNTYGVGATAQATRSTMVPTSTSAFVMGGMGLQFTPAKSGNVSVDFGAYLTTSTTTVDEGITIQLAWGTGSAPSYQASQTGTVVGSALKYSNGVTLTTAADSLTPVSLGSLITGLTPGVEYWIDVQIEGITAEDVTANNCVLSAVEV